MSATDGSAEERGSAPPGAVSVGEPVAAEKIDGEDGGPSDLFEDTFNSGTSNEFSFGTSKPAKAAQLLAAKAALPTPDGEVQSPQSASDMPRGRAGPGHVRTSPRTPRKFGEDSPTDNDQEFTFGTTAPIQLPVFKKGSLEDEDEAEVTFGTTTPIQLPDFKKQPLAPACVVASEADVSNLRSAAHAVPTAGFIMNVPMHCHGGEVNPLSQSLGRLSECSQEASVPNGELYLHAAASHEHNFPGQPYEDGAAAAEYDLEGAGSMECDTSGYATEPPEDMPSSPARFMPDTRHLARRLCACACMGVTFVCAAMLLAYLLRELP